MLYRFDPYHGLERLNEPVAEVRRPHAAPMDAYRVGDEFRVHFDMPGVDAATIELTVEKNVLTVSAERRWGFEGVDVVAAERPQGKFARTLFLGESLDTEHIDASYTDGVLTLRIPVREAAKPRRVAVTATPRSTSIGASTLATSG
jgi:HSP20 family protein